MTFGQIVAHSRTYFLHIGVLIAVMIAGVLFGVQESGQTDIRKAAADTWRLPAATPRAGDNPDDVANVAAMFFDENPTKKTDKSLSAGDKTWHFVGTARQGDHIAAIIVLPKPAKPMHVEVGGKLPGGEEIVAVDDGLLRYRDDAGAHELRAFNLPHSENKDKR